MLENHRDIERHWCPISEKYTGCDSLIAAVNRGWKVYHLASVQITQRRSRLFNTYTFLLTRGALIHTMRVVESPTVRQVIKEYGLTLVSPDRMPHLIDVDRMEATAERPLRVAATAT